MTTNDMRASNEWAKRPDDQRFLTLDALHEKVLARRKISRTVDVALDRLTVQPTVDGEITLKSERGTGATLTHWAFGQLCARAKAPASYLRSLPAELAVAPLQWSLEHHESADDQSNDARILVRQNGSTHIAAINSTSYGRIYDCEQTAMLKKYCDPTIWKVPGATYQAKDPLRATTLYASDRDVFIFLVSENTIDADGESVNRGFYCWNSEVGSATFGIATFTYDYVCDNRIIWGQADFKELVIRHTAGGPQRFIESAVPQLQAYTQSSATSMVDTIKRAKATEVGKSQAEVQAWLKARGFTQAQSRKAYDKAEADPRGYNPRSVWGLVQGLTDAAHDIANTDARVDFETKAGALLDF